MALFKIADPISSYRVGDEPGTLPLELADDRGNPVALDGITGATAELVSPAGTIAALPATVNVAANTIGVEFGTVALDGAGVWTLTVTVTGATSTVATDPAPIVVEAADGWHTLTTARAQWSDAPKLDVALYALLEVAKDQCVEYAPALVETTPPAPIPVPWRQAQLMQARNVWNASKTDPASGGIGSDDLIIRPYPMDQTIRYMLRPKRAIGAVA